MAIAITGQDESATELRRLARASRDVAQARRLLAIALVMEGRSRTDAATAAGMDRHGPAIVARLGAPVQRGWAGRSARQAAQRSPASAE